MASRARWLSGPIWHRSGPRIDHLGPRTTSWAGPSSGRGAPRTWCSRGTVRRYVPPVDERTAPELRSLRSRWGPHRRVRLPVGGVDLDPAGDPTPRSARAATYRIRSTDLHGPAEETTSAADELDRGIEWPLDRPLSARLWEIEPTAGRRERPHRIERRSRGGGPAGDVGPCSPQSRDAHPSDRHDQPVRHQAEGDRRRQRRRRFRPGGGETDHQRRLHLTGPTGMIGTAPPAEPFRTPPAATPCRRVRRDRSARRGDRRADQRHELAEPAEHLQRPRRAPPSGRRGPHRRMRRSGRRPGRPGRGGRGGPGLLSGSAPIRRRMPDHDPMVIPPAPGESPGRRATTKNATTNAAATSAGATATDGSSPARA